MNRRNFLRIALTSGAIAATPIALAVALEKRLPVIYGDGEHDDWEGLQAALDGKDFVCHSGCVTVEGGTVEIRNGDFWVTKTLRVRNENQALRMHHNRFTFPGQLFSIEGNGVQIHSYSSTFIGSKVPQPSIARAFS